MNLAIIYHTESGNTEYIARLIQEGAENINGINGKAMEIRKIDNEFLEKADAVIIGTPTYLADFSWQLKKWFDKEIDVNLSGKLGAVFATARYVGGGSENALLSLIGHMLVKGMIMYSGGAAEGNPYTHYGAVCIQDGTPEQRERARIFGERIAKKARELFN